MTDDRRERLVALGAITRPHGLRGEMRVHRFNPDSDVLLGVERVWLVRDGQQRPVRVIGSRAHGELVLLTLTGVGSREEAEALRGHEVCVPREQLPSPGEDEYYHADLIGLAAFDEAGTSLGEISDVIQYPSTDCLALRTADGVREIPLLDPYVVDVKVDEGRVVLAHVEDFENVPAKRKKRAKK